ncbi:MAG TPA: hypothetical protein VHC43_05720 [Mycobacteriales bacterium]|nr:hypothetical protein [Mycobacteriales bacterium]
MSLSFLIHRRSVTAVAVAAGLGLAAGTATAAPSHREIKTVKISAGRVLAASNNHVLYLFEKDGKNVSHCDSTCRAYWPPVRSKGSAMAAAHVSARHLGLTKKGQVTYYGHPLYFYVGDTEPLQDNGQGSTASGGAWYVVGTNGHAIDSD